MFLPTPTTPPPSHVFSIRAPQNFPSQTTINTSAFFPDPTSVSQNDSGHSTGSVAKTVLEYLFLSIALLIVISLFFKRAHRHKRRQDNLFLPTRRSGTLPRTTGIPPIDHHSSFFPSYPSAAYVYEGGRGRRVMAADVDERGRRIGTGGAMGDWNGGDKDELPAYEVKGGPPTYIELETPRRGNANETVAQQSPLPTHEEENAHPPMETPASQNFSSNNTLLDPQVGRSTALAVDESSSSPQGMIRPTQ